MRERARIAQVFAPLAAGVPGSFDLTDDAALLTPPEGMSLVVTTDSVIQTIHVLADATPAQYAQKLVRRNLSDLAAMGATPWRYTLNLHTPRDVPDHWFADFAAALAAEQVLFDMRLIGGDSTSGGETIHTTMTCFGLTPGPVLRRSGAQPGEDIYVSGTIGDAALGLTLLQHSPQQHTLPSDALIARYHTPQPRLALGLALHGIASAAMDISDGLLADVNQLCAASNMGAELHQAAIPLSPSAQQWLQHNAALWEVILNGGDDYELCFTAAPAMRDTIAKLAASLALPLIRIGTLTSAVGVRVCDENGATLAIKSGGWEHP